VNPDTALVRTYRGASISTTLEDIQRELGDEALVVSVREIPGGAPWEIWKPQEVEVMVIPPADAPPAVPDPEPQAGMDEEPSIQAARQLLALMDQVTRNSAAEQSVEEGEQPPAEEHDSVEEAAGNEEVPVTGQALQELQNRLVRQGLDSELVSRVSRNAAATLSRFHLQDADMVKRHIKQQLVVMVKAYNSLRLRQDRIIFLIGPRGSGKTTMAAKLAVYHSEDLKQKVTWICADTIRAASINEAKVYCDSLGVPLMLAYTPRELVECIREAEGSDLILVDTPGFNSYLESDVLQVGKFLTAVPGRSTYLLAPASTKESDLMDMAAAFEPFQPDSLVLTRLDETGTYGSIFNFACKSGIPLAYFASGPDVFDDLRPANPSRLVDALLGDGTMR